jgi:RNA polymerase sigma-70 factor (ECF subfamily)
VDELFQETWLRVIRKSESFEQYRFKGWIFKIAYNLVIDWSRSKRGNLSLDQTSEYTDGLQTLGDTLPAPGFSPDGQAANVDLQKEIMQALASLPVEQREVFVMRMEADMSFKEIAEIQGTSINTALARMQYALTKMRKELKNLHEDSAGSL